MLGLVVFPVTNISSFVVWLHADCALIPSIMVEKQEQIPSAASYRVQASHPVADHLESSARRAYASTLAQSHSAPVFAPLGSTTNSLSSLPLDASCSQTLPSKPAE